MRFEQTIDCSTRILILFSRKVFATRMTIGCFPFSHNSSLTTKQPTNQVKNFLLGLTLNVLGHYDHINSGMGEHRRSTIARNEMSARSISDNGGISTREEAKMSVAKRNETKNQNREQSRNQGSRNKSKQNERARMIKKSRIAKQIETKRRVEYNRE